MSKKVFIDTNILVYANDKADSEKRSRALHCLQEADVSRVLSTQILQEFYVTCTRKLGMLPADTKELLRSLNQVETVLVDPPLILEAIDCSAMDQLSFWDALVVVSAEKSLCREVWTEDLNDGQIIRGVQVKNPFR